MPLPTDFKWVAGKSAMMGSLYEYLTTNILDETFDFDNPIIPVKLPAYGVSEKGLYNRGPIALDDFLGYKNSKGLYGRLNQTLVEVSAWDDETIHPEAVGKVRQMRDKIVYLLYNAGRKGDDNVFVLPPIKLYNYYSLPTKTEIGAIYLDPSDNAINEKFIIDPVNQNVKIYKLLVRLFWIEYFNQA